MSAVAERTWVEGRGKRPEWLTDDECELVAERTRMAMAEAGVLIEWGPAEIPSEGAIADRPLTQQEDAIFKRARRLALASIGAVLVEDADA